MAKKKRAVFKDIPMKTKKAVFKKLKNGKLTAKEAADTLSCSLSAVYYYYHDGRYNS